MEATATPLEPAVAPVTLGAALKWQISIALSLVAGMLSGLFALAMSALSVLNVFERTTVNSDLTSVMLILSLGFFIFTAHSLDRLDGVRRQRKAEEWKADHCIES